MATFNTPIIPTEAQAGANAFWETAGAGPNTFTVGLVPANGPADATPPTHYYGSGQLERYFPTATEEFPAQFPDTVMLRFVGNSAGNLDYVLGELAARNLQRQNLSGM